MVPSGYWGYPNKFSFRLYFRDLYGDPKLNYPLFPKFDTDSFDNVVLRGGHNDMSNPFIRDELSRRLHKDMGQVACSGSFANLFINGEYKGFYNITEHVSESFCQHWFNSNQAWDVMTMSGIREGDTAKWNEMMAFADSHNMSNSGNYLEMLKRIDVVNFIDYLILQLYGANWDWPQNNWSAASRTVRGRSMAILHLGRGRRDGSNRHGQSIRGSQLAGVGAVDFASSDEGPSRLPPALVRPAAKAFPGNRRRHDQRPIFWNGSTISRAEVIGIVPNMSTFLPNTWFPQREDIFFGQCKTETLFTFAAPILSVNGAVRSGGNAWPGDSLSMANAPAVTGAIYYTLDGTDPRQSSDALSISNLTLVPESAAKKIFVPTSNIGTTWTRWQ